MGLAQSKKQFYHKGVDVQKVNDISIDLKRQETLLIKEWTVEQKLIARAFMNDVDVSYQAWRKEILKAIK